MDILTKPLWFVDEVQKSEHIKRISNVVDIKQYLLRLHNVLQRKDFVFKEETYRTAKIVLNTLKSIINFHVSYVVGNPISITGEQDIVKKYNNVYKKGIFNKTDYEVVTDLYTYGDAFEYVYLTGDKTIKSKVIANEDAYPVYDEHFNYVAFIEYWDDIDTGHKNYIVYTPFKVLTYENERLVSEVNNLTGLPIHYSMMDKSEYNFFGDSIMNDLIPVMNQIELLLSKLDDAITTLSLNPLGVSAGQRINESIPKDIVGATLNLEDGGDFKWVNATMDYNNIKLLLDSLNQQLYAVAGVPASAIGQGNISNVSEVSLKLLFSQMDNKAKQTIQVLREGFFKRFEYIRKLLKLQGITFNDDNFDSLDITFSVNRPVDTASLMDELKVQYDMGAISKQTIIDISPYSVDTALELQRIESEAKPVNNPVEIDNK
ncbi:phage portal protein [Acetanaerobacterium elongatum]|uniref:Phage portal protein, SPP1 family n=1 Tax=Acetanaerobacterium elongatum TaxID=258515 RepID=A0A1H0BMB1_9FIRM|nr:phage portal protein [Acetanaerobacterium elongatum]SDN46741.1 phage portal protein, SPP1 family [Acetanaerobacterium elongatum]